MSGHIAEKKKRWTTEIWTFARIKRERQKAEYILYQHRAEQR